MPPDNGTSRVVGTFFLYKISLRKLPNTSTTSNKHVEKKTTTTTAKKKTHKLKNSNMQTSCGNLQMFE